MSSYDGFEYMQQGIGVTFDQLTAPGTTDSVNCKFCHNPLFSYTIGSIDTNVDVKFEGSSDDTNWYNLDTSASVQQTANGTYMFRYESKGEVLYARMKFLSEAGGTRAFINALLTFGNG